MADASCLRPQACGLGAGGSARMTRTGRRRSHAVSAESVTELLHRWRKGDTTALDALVPRIYAELHRIADAHLRREGEAPVSFQPTALVHETYLKMAAGVDVDWQGR